MQHDAEDVEGAEDDDEDKYDWLNRKHEARLVEDRVPTPPNVKLSY